MLLFLATFYASIGVLTLHDTSNNKKEEKAEKSIEKWPFRLIQNKHAISVIFVADEDVILEAANVFFHLRSEKARNCTSQDCSIFFELTKSNDKGNDRSVLDKGFFHTTHFRTKTTERITFKRSPRLRKGEMYQFSFLKRNREIVYAARFMSHHLNENLKLNRSVVGNNTDSFHYYGIKFITKVKQLVPEIEGFKNYEQGFYNYFILINKNIIKLYLLKKSIIYY